MGGGRLICNASPWFQFELGAWEAYKEEEYGSQLLAELSTDDGVVVVKGVVGGVMRPKIRTIYFCGNIKGLILHHFLRFRRLRQVVQSVCHHTLAFYHFLREQHHT